MIIIIMPLCSLVLRLARVLHRLRLSLDRSSKEHLCPLIIMNYSRADLCSWHYLSLVRYRWAEYGVVTTDSNAVNHPNHTVYFQSHCLWDEQNSFIYCLCSFWRIGCSEAHTYTQNEGLSHSHWDHEGTPGRRVWHHRGLWGNTEHFQSTKTCTVHAR